MILYIFQSAARHVHGGLPSLVAVMVCDLPSHTGAGAEVQASQEVRRQMGSRLVPILQARLSVDTGRESSRDFTGAWVRLVKRLP